MSNQYVEMLKQQAALNQLNYNNFDNIERTFIVKPGEEQPPEQEVNLDKNIAETNLAQITTSNDVAKIILDSLSQADIIALNRNFNVFKAALKDIKIQSLGQFNRLFNSFRTNIVPDLARTGLTDNTAQIAENIELLRKQLNIQNVSIDDLNKLTKKQIDDLFRDAIKTATKSEPYLNQELEILKADLKDMMDVYIFQISPLISLKTMSGDKKFAENGEQNAKIRYILKTFRPTLPIKSNSVKWTGSTVETVSVTPPVTPPVSDIAVSSGSGLIHRIMHGSGTDQKKRSYSAFMRSI
jgi:hypothetical protein